jgi:phosphate uptake regulator
VHENSLLGLLPSLEALPDGDPALLAPSADGSGFLLRPFVGPLVISYIVDEGDSDRALRHRDLVASGLTETQIHEQAVANLARHVKAMVHNALNAFARLDTKAALDVVKADETVDEEYESIYRQGITFMMEDPRTISRIMDSTWMARALERIGDHAKNICEYVIFMVHGKDLRYTGLKNIEAEVEQATRRQETRS